MSALRDALTNVVRASTKHAQQDEERARVSPALEPGQRFTMHRDCCVSQAELERVYEVVRVNQGSATVKALNARHVEVRDKHGAVAASWDAPGRVFTISAHASVVLQVQA